jgi:hypothetical protein
MEGRFRVEYGYRSGLEGLSNRVQHLEDIILYNADLTGTDIGNPLVASTENEQFSSSSDTGQLSSMPVTNTEPLVVKSYRGATSPWTTLVDHLQTTTNSGSHMDALQANAARLANEERTSVLSEQAINFNILQEFPRLSKADAVKFVKNYAVEAPYPILHYDSIMEITEQLLDTNRLSRWGQIGCVLLVTA